MIKIVGLLLVAAIATYGLYAFAQIRADVRPSMTPIGSSSSNGISLPGFTTAPSERFSFAVSVKLLGIPWIARRRRHYSSAAPVTATRDCPP
jgi:hypothetical protein